MNKKYLLITSIICVVLGSYYFFYKTKNTLAICIVPVADLSYQSVCSDGPKECPKKLNKIYNNLPVYTQTQYESCQRTHQLLFNEIVEVIEENNEEIKIKLNSVAYKNSSGKLKDNFYWTFKGNLTTLDNLKLQNLDLNLIPEPINYKTTTFEVPFKNTLTLILPFYDKETDKTYSAGTRFKYNKKDNDSYEISIFDPNKKVFINSKVDKKLANESELKTHEEKINNFVNLLKLWTSFGDKFIPYVQGGQSFQVLIDDTFYLEKGVNCINQKFSFFKRADDNVKPYSGFTCSGLIVRTAQICEIPLLCKNSILPVRNAAELLRSNCKSPI